MTKHTHYSHDWKARAEFKWNLGIADQLLKFRTGWALKNHDDVESDNRAQEENNATNKTDFNRA